MEVDTYKDFLLESRRIEPCTSHQINRCAAQFVGGILQRLRIEHHAILRAEDGMDDHRLVKM